MGCYNDDLLFIHIPKTAGTAIKHALWSNVPGMKGQAPSSPGEGARKPDKDNPFPIGHIRLRDCERLLKRPASSFRYVVAVIRNPYVHQVSQWKFWAERYQIGGRHHHDIVAGTYPTIHGFLEDPRCDFHRWYLSDVFREPPEPTGPHNGYAGWIGYYPWWLIDVHGKLPPNLVLLRQEQLAADWEAFTSKLYGAPVPLRRVNALDWKEAKTMNYYLHPDLPVRSFRALDLVEAKFNWAFNYHYAKFDRRQVIQEWARLGALRPEHMDALE